MHRYLRLISSTSESESEFLVSMRDNLGLASINCSRSRISNGAQTLPLPSRAKFSTQNLPPHHAERRTAIAANAQRGPAPLPLQLWGKSPETQTTSPSAPDGKPPHLGLGGRAADGRCALSASSTNSSRRRLAPARSVASGAPLRAARRDERRRLARGAPLCELLLIDTVMRSWTCFLLFFGGAHEHNGAYSCLAWWFLLALSLRATQFFALWTLVRSFVRASFELHRAGIYPCQRP